MTLLLLVETEAFLDLDLSQRAALQAAARRVPGFKVVQRQMRTMADALSGREDSIALLVLKVPSERAQLNRWLDELLKCSPLPALYGLCFLLYCEAGLDPRTWEDPGWTDLLDRFQEIAVPSGIVVLTEADSRLDSFRVVECLSSLTREMDSLNELRRLDDEISKVEERLKSVQKKLK